MVRNLILQTDILSQADDFYEAYRRCIEPKNTQTDASGNTVSNVVNIPAVVNGAFACELYLKSMLGQSKEHKLQKLFSKLSEKQQLNISREMELCLNSTGRQDGFPYYLLRASDTFCRWRYILEYSHSEGFFGTMVNEYLMFFGLFLPVLQKEAKSSAKIRETE